MDDLKFLAITGGNGLATLSAAAAALVKTDLDEESAVLLSRLTRLLLERISRPLAQNAA